MNNKTVIGLSTAACLAVLSIGGLVTRQVIGSSMGKSCDVAAAEFTEVANLQVGDMKSAEFYIEQISANPFSALMVGADVMRLANTVSNRWDDYNAKMDAKDEVCYPTGFVVNTFQLDSYVRDTRMAAYDLEVKVEKLTESIQEKAAQF